ncbi:MAG TPA: ORF6N domain-containing protein [Candidatus Sulfotelmatobacter sp.]|nr:ORF6N domain-containing protein [Candidatus Sulfotelmatobacter sp.]
MNNKGRRALLAPSRIENKIFIIRRQKVMISSDLAMLYQVRPKALIQAVKRNASRFPDDFMFQLTQNEARNLKSQTVTSSWGGARRALPYAFTEQGVAMLSSVLHSERAVQVNIAIMRAFLQLRSLLATHEDLRRKIDELEKRYDSQFQAVFATLRQMLETPLPQRREIGFHAHLKPVRRRPA